MSQLIPYDESRLTQPERLEHNTTEGAIAKAIINGDLSSLTAVERRLFYFAVCKSQGLNPLAHPFDYIEDQGRLKLHPNANCAAQLREQRGIQTRIIDRQILDDMVIVTAEAFAPDGRTEQAIGCVSLITKDGKKLTGQRRADAMMKADSKAKRRATLDLCGLSWDGRERRTRSAEFYDPPEDVCTTR